MTAFEKIKEAREREGLKQSDIANELGISQNNVSKLESGSAKFIPNSYIEFLQKRNYDINSLFDDEQPLRKLDDVGKVLFEPRGAYDLDTEKVLSKNVVGTLKKSLGIEGNRHLIELFNRFDENTNSTVNLHEMLILHAWEKVYLARMKQMERDIDELRQKLQQLTDK